MEIKIEIVTPRDRYGAIGTARYRHGDGYSDNRHGDGYSDRYCAMDRTI